MKEKIITIIKTIIFYVVMLIIVRLLGKREVGEISVFDLVILLIIADIATLSINEGWGMVIPSILSLFSLLLMQKIIAYLALRFTFIRKLTDYSPSIIIYDGKLNLKEMKRQAYTVEDLLHQARDKGIMNLVEIKMAILEPTGQLSIYKKEEYVKQILPVVISGSFREDNIKLLNIDKDSITEYIKKKELMLLDIHYLASDGKNYYLMEIL